MISVPALAATGLLALQSCLDGWRRMVSPIATLGIASAGLSAAVEHRSLTSNLAAVACAGAFGLALRDLHRLGLVRQVLGMRRRPTIALGDVALFAAVGTWFTPPTLWLLIAAYPLATSTAAVIDALRGAAMQSRWPLAPSITGLAMLKIWGPTWFH